MSNIAEKLTTIAENQQRVYDAGYAAGLGAIPQLTTIYENGNFTTASNITTFNKEVALYPGGVELIGASGWEVVGLDFNSDNISISWNAGKSGSVVSDAMIDFTNYKSIRIESVNVQGNTHLVKGVLYKLGTDGDLLNRVDEDAIVFNLNTDFDLSEVNGEYYIGIFCSTEVFTQVEITNISVASGVSGFGTAKPEHVLEGYTFSNDYGVAKEGTIPVYSYNIGALSLSRSVGGGEWLSFEINPGYYKKNPYTTDGLVSINYDWAEVLNFTGFTAYKNAVVTSLAQNGFEITNDTKPGEVRNMLLQAFPPSYLKNFIPDLQTGDITATTTNGWTAKLVGNKISGDNSTSGGYNEVLVWCNASIDFTNYSKIRILISDLNVPEGYPFTIGYTDIVGIGCHNLYNLTSNTGTFDITLDVSGISGEKHLVFKSYLGQNYSYEFGAIQLL